MQADRCLRSSILRGVGMAVDALGGLMPAHLEGVGRPALGLKGLPCVLPHHGLRKIHWMSFKQFVVWPKTKQDAPCDSVGVTCPPFRAFNPHWKLSSMATMGHLSGLRVGVVSGYRS